MSDEYQPNDVVDSQSEPEAMPAEPVLVEPDEAVAAPEVAPTDATQGETVMSEPEAQTQVVSDPSAEAAAVTADLSSAEAAATETAPEPVIPGSVAVDDAPVTAVAAPSPRVVSIADLESAQAASNSADRPALSGVASLLAGRGWIVAAAVAVLVIVLLFLPPISLAQRIGNSGGYTVLDSETTTVEHPDGLRVSRPADAEGKVRVKLGSVPRAEFVDSAASDDLISALEALPTSLTPKSPYYTIDVKSSDPVAGQLEVLIPNEAEPWETLDLYAWDADSETWTWLPTKLDRTAEVLVSDVEQLPASVLVVQSESVSPIVVTEVESWPATDVAATGVDEADVSGILIGTMGGIAGYSDQLPAATAGGTVVLVPTVRNWVLDRPENWSLVSDMLMMESDRAAHVANLLSLAQTGGYPGLALDYRSVQLQDRDLFSQFVSELGSAFHAQGLWVAVVVGTPQLGTDGAWDTGGYDWAALGSAADRLRVVMPLTTAAYEPGGGAERLVQWAVTQVARYKLMPVYSTLSTDGQVTVAMDTVLASLGNVSVMQTMTESVIPGTSLSLTLGQVGVLEDPATQATSIVVGDETYWLGTPQWLRTRMDLVSRYRLGGVVLRDLFDEGNMAGMLSVVADFKTAGTGTAGTMPEVVWSVTDPAGQTTQASTPFAQAGYAWSAPAVTGTYSIAATVAGVDKGSVEALVAVPAPVVTGTVAVGEDDEPAGTPDEEATDGGAEAEEADETMKAGFVADVNVPDNTQLEKGESFTKTWRMRNVGTADWPEDTVLVFAGDTQLGDVVEVEVGAVTGGETVDISVELVAPDEDGTYKSTWVLRTGGKNISGGGIYVQIRVGEPAAVAQPSGPTFSAPVATGSFELGGHIRDLGLPYKDKMKYAGMTWIKTQIFYGQDAAGMVAVAHNNGFKIQLSAIGGAGMVTEAGYEDKFAAWTGQLAAAGADAIEVWNEPNIDREWQIGLISPVSYTNLLCKSYSAIKSANAGTAVISAAPAPTGWFGGCGPNGCDDQPWMEGLYNAGAANCMDYIGAHHNAGATSPSAAIGHP
ncbi:MAG: NBR1-Ig-like domain-containing protein, partial [Anaerolineae bacterium]|nr:NBR1-Ig-like domain-containing protein [Anaerolineae bacterium]